MVWSGATAKSAIRSSRSMGNGTLRAGWSGRPGCHTSNWWLTWSSSQMEPSWATSNDHGPLAVLSVPSGGWEKPTWAASAWAATESGVCRWPNRWLPSGTRDGAMVVAAAGWSMALAVMTAMAVRMTAAMLWAGRMVTSFLERTLLVVLAVWAGPVTVRHQGSVVLMAE
jgi:hypothetical protein